MYKIVFEVVEVNEPRSINGNPTHVTRPCRVYKLGDKMTLRVPPEELVMEETDAVCLSAFSAIMPLTGAFVRGAREDWDYLDKIQFFRCPDAERPVIFKIKRIQLEQEKKG